MNRKIEIQACRPTEYRYKKHMYRFIDKLVKNAFMNGQPMK